MTSQQFIEELLADLKYSKSQRQNLPREDLAAAIYSQVMSKKFRKYSVSSIYKKRVKDTITQSVEEKSPILFSFPFGGYKLWRLDEAPEVDWAEFFFLTYLIKWLGPVCEMYAPGVVFDFVSDDVIVEKINNIPKRSTDQYKKSFMDLISFIKLYGPENLTFDFTPIGSLYSPAEFDFDLEKEINLARKRHGGLPIIDEQVRASIDLNVRLGAGQQNDPQWREKIELVHDAYYGVSRRRPYIMAPNKILVFAYPVNGCDAISVGTTKTSIAKFWVSIGALQQVGEAFREHVLSPKQAASLTQSTSFESIKITGLLGKNFGTIRVVHK